MKLLKLLHLQQLLTPAGRFARLRAIKTALQRMRLRNHDFSLITNNCLGGMVLPYYWQPDVDN